MGRSAEGLCGGAVMMVSSPRLSVEITQRHAQHLKLSIEKNKGDEEEGEVGKEVACYSAAPLLFLLPPLPPLRLALSSSPASYRQNMGAAESRDVTSPAVAVATPVTATKGGKALPRRTTCCLYKKKPSGSRCGEHLASSVGEDLRTLTYRRQIELTEDRRG